MLEILFLIYFCRKLAGIAREKNRSSSWGALGIIGFIGGEFGGGVLGVSGGADGTGLYGYAILGAIIGAVAAYVIVKTLAPIPPDHGLPQARVV